MTRESTLLSFEVGDVITLTDSGVTPDVGKLSPQPQADTDDTSTSSCAIGPRHTSSVYHKMNNASLVKIHLCIWSTACIVVMC